MILQIGIQERSVDDSKFLLPPPYNWLFKVRSQFWLVECEKLIDDELLPFITSCSYNLDPPWWLTDQICVYMVNVTPKWMKLQFGLAECHKLIDDELLPFITSCSYNLDPPQWLTDHIFVYMVKVTPKRMKLQSDRNWFNLRISMLIARVGTKTGEFWNWISCNFIF